MSAGSKTNPGGYASRPDAAEQFEVADRRTPAEVAAVLRTHGYEPVWKDWDAVFSDHGNGSGVSRLSQSE
jgi:2-iminoacetate synthase